jgi:hypothetical protein
VDNQRPAVDTFYPAIHGFSSGRTVLFHGILEPVQLSELGSYGPNCSAGIYIVQNFTKFKIGRFHKLRGSELARQVHHSRFSAFHALWAYPIRNLELLSWKRMCALIWMNQIPRFVRELINDAQSFPGLSLSCSNAD